MTICFFGTRSSIDYHQIGGTENYVRRIGSVLSNRGYDVDYVMYDGEGEFREEVQEEISLHYFQSFENALRFVHGQYTDIITVYIRPLDRIKYHAFKKFDRAANHFIYFSWPDSVWKRWIYFNEHRFFSPDGTLFCISERQHSYVNDWTKSSHLLLPPLPSSYFVTPSQKEMEEKIRIRFIGRVDPQKGIYRVIDLFESLDSDLYECSLHGIHVADDREANRIHKQLKQHETINYVHQERKEFTYKIEQEVGELLYHTDIFVQPYRRLSSTIDTPLLILEAMASLAPVVTVDHKNIRNLYGESEFLFPVDSSTEEIVRHVRSITRKDIRKERERLHQRVNELNVEADAVADRFVNELAVGTK